MVMGGIPPSLAFRLSDPKATKTLRAAPTSLWRTTFMPRPSVKNFTSASMSGTYSTVNVEEASEPWVTQPQKSGDARGTQTFRTLGKGTAIPAGSAAKDATASHKPSSRLAPWPQITHGAKDKAMGPGII